jgi:Protein of unknown function (DUF4435)
MEWPVGALKAMPSFFSKWNDIDVYVEDTADHAKTLYTEIVNRALAGKAKIAQVFPLGDRKKVIDGCAGDKRKGGRPRVYLVDADLDLISGIPAPAIPRLYRHEVYALEGYLVCEAALLEILHEENPKLAKADVAANFDFNGFCSACGILVDLFTCFGVSWLIDSSLKTKGFGLGEFLDGSEAPWLDAGRIIDFCVQRYAELATKTSSIKVVEVERRVRQHVCGASRQLDLIAAREFVIPLLRLWARGKDLRLNTPKENLYLRLAKRADLVPRASFVKVLRDTARQ